MRPNSEHVYYWEITSDVSPQQNDPTCLTYTYISHKDVVEDYNSGLIGALLICKSGEMQNRFQLGWMGPAPTEIWTLFFNYVCRQSGGVR